MEYSFISSRKNQTLLRAYSLSSEKRVRDELGLFCAEGYKLLSEALESNLSVESVFFTQKALDNFYDLLEKCDSKTALYLVTDECFSKLTTEKAPQGIFSCIRKPQSTDLCASDGNFIILDEIQNPLNIGAIIRCAYSLGQNKIVLSSNCADPYSPKTVRAAMGSLFKVKLYTNIDTKEFIKEQQTFKNRVFCTALHTHSKTLGTFDFLESDSIVICNEGHGASKELLDVCYASLEIPMFKGAESLNAATACAVVLWEKNKNILTKNANNLI